MIKIRKGIQNDLPIVLDLIKELAKYENALHEVIINIETLTKDGFKENPNYYFLIAEKNNQIIGTAFYFIRYSTWRGKMLFLEDFIVKKEHRKSGVGTKLFDEIIKICKNEDLNGMCWQVLNWNKPAIKFYKKYNASISNQWLNGMLNKNQINNFTFV